MSELEKIVLDCTFEVFVKEALAALYKGVSGPIHLTNGNMDSVRMASMPIFGGVLLRLMDADSDYMLYDYLDPKIFNITVPIVYDDDTLKKGIIDLYYSLQDIEFEERSLLKEKNKEDHERMIDKLLKEAKDINWLEEPRPESGSYDELVNRVKRRVNEE